MKDEGGNDEVKGKRGRVKGERILPFTFNL